MEIACQIAIVAVMVLQFFVSVHGDFEGREGKKAAGFYGFTVSLAAVAVQALVLYGAGAFSRLLP